MTIDGADADPVAIDLNVDSALFLMDEVGIDSYPMVLALMPNIADPDDRDRVYAVVREQLAEAGMVDGDRVHPTITRWLRCLDRPDTELVVRILTSGRDGTDPTMLRMSLVRSGEEHVLAVRHGDHVVIQGVFHEGTQLRTLSAAVTSALGTYPTLEFEPFSATMESLNEIPDDPDERRRGFLELGAVPHTASVLARALEEVMRRTEIVMVEHRDGGAGSYETPVCVSVLDTESGRLVVTPNAALDEQIWSTYAPGDDAALLTSMGALVDLLPGRSWFDTRRVSE